MEQHSFYGKQELCYTEVSDFTDFQGIGRDPLYRRYDSVVSVVRRVVPSEYEGFLAAPDYQDVSDQIHWHIDKWSEQPVKFPDLNGEQKTQYEEIKNKTIAAYKDALGQLQGDDLRILAGAIKYLDDEQIYCADGKVFAVAWGMTPDARKHKVIGAVIHDLDVARKFKLVFYAGEHGSLASKLDQNLTKRKGYILTAADVPQVVPNDGWTFARWTPDPVGFAVNESRVFTAQYDEVPQSAPAHEANHIEAEPEPQPRPEPRPEPQPQPAPEPEDHRASEPEPEPEPESDRIYTITFETGDKGIIRRGTRYLTKVEGTRIVVDEVPLVSARSGYKFIGWDAQPTNTVVYGDMTFVAQYADDVPWYRQLWNWLTGKGCLRTLLWILLILLGLFLLAWLLRGCGHLGSENGIVPIDTITRPDGRIVDDNGVVKPVTGDDGVLPGDDAIVAPVTGDDGADVPVIENPGVPDIIANRLFLFIEDEDDTVDALAKDFKKAYPDSKYSIISYDKNVKYIVIQIPEDERDQIRKTINSKIPNHKFLVFDEEIYDHRGRPSTGTTDVGWHLKAINLKQGWAITKGSSDIKVGIVDDGIDATHPMFSGRIVDAYNVFTQNNKLSTGTGHGTHVASLACGSADFYDSGASGVAPNSQIMPVQVFDNEKCPLSGLVAGIMYTIHHGADVVNISVGPSFEGLNALPEDQQKVIAEQQFKNMEGLWRRVCELATSKNCILVFAAGNDNILSCVPPENRNSAAISVSAVDRRISQTSFTNYGEGSDVSAPGKDIYSAYPVRSFKSLDGTSMAAPIITGTIALMKSLKKDLTTQQARNCIYNTGRATRGDVPPMVMVDMALQGVKNGNFSAPDGKTGKADPVGGTGGAGDAGNVGTPGTGVGGDTPGYNDGGTQPADETDYDAIRRMIAEYQRKIEELEKLLPQK